MKYYILGILASMLSLQAFAGAGSVYVTPCDGHTVRFLIVSGNGAGIEEYYAQAKASVYRLKQQPVKAEELVRHKDNIVYKGEVYWLSRVNEACGDFTRFYAGFGKLDNAQKLNVCRNILTCRQRQSFKKTFEENVAANQAILNLPPADFNAKMK